MFDRIHISQVIFWLALGLLAGVGQLTLTVVASLAVVLVWRHPKKFVVIVLVILGWWLGQWRYQLFGQVADDIPFNTTVDLVGYVSAYPRRTATDQKLYVTTEQWSGAIYLTVPLYPQYHYGDMVQGQCMIVPPEPIEDFAFDKYLARHGAKAICRQPHLHHVPGQGGYWWYRQISQWRDTIQQRVQQLWPQPTASIMLGLLLGIQDDLSPKLVDTFRRAGVIHILVVSGMHISIIVAVMTAVMQRWLSPRQLLIILILILGMFTVLTGLAASVWRASLMGSIPVLARAYQRRPTMHHSLVVVAASMAAHNPYIVLHDVGFQLSFLATLGIIYIRPLLEPYCGWVPTSLTLRETLTTTLAATIATTPLLLSVFGSVAVVGPFTNIVVVPTSNILLFAGIITVAIAPLLGEWPWLATYPVHTLTDWMIWFVERSAELPWASLTDIQLPSWSMVAWYAGLTMFILWHERHVTA
ncbi:MAG: ComEC/Rec2 family competence protein [Candidatus Kerfeldbacteria bacterium]|nr:ComEC/Rec2 family competence protein [Candidatus Kerfeldbacteria bacterium]